MPRTVGITEKLTERPDAAEPQNSLQNNSISELPDNNFSSLFKSKTEGGVITNPNYNQYQHFRFDFISHLQNQKIWY